MDDEETEWLPMELSEEVVEIIIAKMSFPSLFKARLLSKCWKSKFTDLSCEATRFRRLVSANSASWGITHAPVLLDRTSRSLLAFDDTTKSEWFAPLPPYFWQSQWDERLQLEGDGPSYPVSLAGYFAGALVLIAGISPPKFSVANIVTGSSCQMMVPSSLGYNKWDANPGPLSLIAVGSLSYKVLWVHYDSTDLDLEFLNESDIDAFSVHLYDSQSRSWNSTLNKFSDHRALNGFDHFWNKNCAYMAGKVYFLAEYRARVHGHLVEKLKLVSYDVENTGWKIVVKGFAVDANDDLHDDSGVFRCGDKIIVVIMSAYAMYTRKGKNVEEGFFVGEVREELIQVFQLDLQSSKLVPISHGPPKNIRVLLEIRQLDDLPISKLSADANFLNFGWDCLPSSVVKFNLNTRQWSLTPFLSSTLDINWKKQHLDWIHGVFEPGLNPFVLP